MRLVQFQYNSRSAAHFGVELLEEDVIVDLLETGAKTTMDFLNGGEEMKAKVQRAIDSKRFRVPRSEVILLAPITGPDKVLCIGMNYKDHCEEQGAPVPTEPVVFNKFPSCIAGPTDPLPYPEVTKELDWEVELAIVIGKRCKNISEGDALDHILGFTVAHDVSARDWQMKRNGGQWLVGKAMDCFSPIGPAIVTPDELGDPHNLGIRCTVNGVTKQNSNTNQLVFNTEKIVAWCSKLFTLLPGDLILTGTPPGVGVFMKPPEFLKKGDVVECSIDGIGTVKNTVV